MGSTSYQLPCSATLANATVSSYQHSGTATCNTGYGGYSSQKTRTCNNGTWNGSCDANTGSASYRSCTKARGNCNCRTVSRSLITTGETITGEYIYDSRCSRNEPFLPVTVTCENGVCSYP